MREYGQVQCHFWQSPEALSFSNEAKLLALYLLTGPHSNGLGCYRLPDGYITADLAWSAQTVTKAFAELSRTGFAYRFDQVVLLPKFLHWNGISNPKVAIARRKEFDALPAGEAKGRLARAMLEFGKHWPKGFDTVLKRYAEGYSKQEPTLPNPTQKEPEPSMGQLSPAPPDDFDERFEELRAIYPKRSGHQRWPDAKKHIRARLREKHTWDEILDGARRYAAWVRAAGKERMETVLQAATFVGENKAFLDPWDPPATKADARLSANLSAAEEFKRRIAQ